MSHMCGRTSDKEKILNIFNKQLKTTNKNVSVKRFHADRKYLNHHSKTEGQMKRLRSRKERSRMRGGGKEASNSKSHHHHHRCHSTSDMAPFQSCCHSSCHCLSGRNTHFPNAVPAAQEPSIITDSRLIGHHGLFNHEVKSVDIERLLSQQRKLEKKGQQGQEKNNVTSHPSLTSHIPSPFSTNDLLGADEDEVLPFVKKAAWEKEISQGSDITPGQRLQQQCDLSSESVKSISPSKHSSLDVVTTKSMKTNPVTSEKGRKSPLTPTVERDNVKKSNRKVKGHMISTLECTPKNQESPVHQTQAPGLSTSPLELSSSHTAASFDIQNKGPHPSCVSKSVGAMAASLCDCLQFPLLRRRNLVEESREVLLKALRERHGPRLQENLLEVQRCLNFGADPTKEVQHQKPAMTDPDAFTVFEASQPCFDTQETTSFSMMGSQYFKWKSRPQPHQNLEQTAEWFTSPVETSVSLVDDVLSPTCTPQFSMNFEPSGASASDRLFSSTSSWGKKTSAFQHWEDRFNMPNSSKAVMFDSFENSHMNHTRAFPERSGAQSSGSNIQPFFPYQAQLLDRCSAEPVLHPKEKDPFAADRYSFPPSFSAQIHHRQQRLQPFSQFSHPSTCPPLMPHHTDMTHYPPSHMLDRDPAAPLSSFPSPEHWSFPPMRLY